MPTYTCYIPVHFSRHWPRFSPTIHDDQENWPRRRLTAIYLCAILSYWDASVCNFWHTWTCPSGKFRCFAHCDERTMRRVHCKTTCLYITFRFTKTCICITTNILHYVFYLPWRRGSVVRASVSDCGTFPDMRLIYGWRVTTSWVRRPLSVNQPGQLSLLPSVGRGMSSISVS